MLSPRSLPLDAALYAQVKEEADLLYAVPSAYKSGWIVKTYTKRGGRYRRSTIKKKKENKEGPSSTLTGIARWFAEKWVNLNEKRQDGTYAPCGRETAKRNKKNKDPYPLCRPSVRVTPQTPKTVDELTPKEIRAAQRQKIKVGSKGKVRNF